MAATQPTIIDTLKKSFVDVPINAEKDNAVSTVEFLEAVESMTFIFDLLGSVAFAPVKSDILGNVKKLKDRYTAAPAQSATIQELAINELATKKHVATEGLVWLIRGLDFVNSGLSLNLANPTQELADSFRTAYGNTLKPHHSMLLKPVISAAMGACPYRKVFYEKLGTDEAKVQEQLRAYTAALEKIVGILKGFLARPEAKW